MTYSGELLLYLVHALLHAAGYRDKSPEDQKIMREQEKRVIDSLQAKGMEFPVEDRKIQKCY